MPAGTTYQDGYTYISNATSGFVGSNVAAVASAIAPAAYTLAAVYVILWGISYLRGMATEPITDSAIRILKVALILGVGINLMQYNTLVVDTFMNAPEQMALALSPTSTGSSLAASLDHVLYTGFKIGDRFWAEASVFSSNIGLYIAAFLVWALVLAVTAYAFFLIALAKIALSFILALGPIFILSLLFQPTASFFSSWIQQLANYWLVIVLSVLANVFVLILILRAAIAMPLGTPTISAAFPFLAMGLFSLFVLAQVPSIAAGLAGGLSLSSYGMGRFGLAVFANPMRRAASSATRSAGRRMKSGTKRVARRGWDSLKNRRKNTAASA